MKRYTGFILSLGLAGAIAFSMPCQHAFAQEKKDQKPAADSKKETPAFMNAWKNIQSTVNQKRTSKTTQGVATAGVRGAEAEDQIVSQMYYRGGTTYPTKSRIQNAILVLSQTVKDATDPASTAETRFYIAQCHIELGETDKAIATYKEIMTVAPKSEWATKAKDEIKKLEAK
ncbi:MAG: tetratricopeptide repeat protein [candidate division Zixibacteria bacterium]|nr:tetratricopeptide repeat protein [candidate division Zixibacteria bacterium]